MRLSNKEKLEHLVERSITKVFKDSLVYIEMCGMEKAQFERIRKHILRSGNDEIRKVKVELDKYEVKYHPSYDEHIYFK
ncbi:hypothetical protein [Chengkuizengella axinellae]|uniref:Uncharacterized protein n=1 Tax=Chengkuizengella axinellae TaxID=3064388 RepID=A0ABT9IWM5_9BACL|nr:hypothetical protein [Chengkuizengella sp. 2205SS18-9]MDP5273658.1 hypothetical protein [Chengkuizengella sp. 2205SS18-9]